MTELLTALEQTISSLETLRDRQSRPDPQLIRKISDLYDQEQRLLESEISMATADYQQATAAMKKAAAKAKTAAADLSDVTGLLNNIAAAIEAVEGLIG